MNGEYWTAHYQEAERQPPSPFAIWAKPRIRGSLAWDIGSGDGRDTGYLGAVSVDAHSSTADFQADAATFMAKESCFAADTVYVRWFLHAVEEDVEDQLLLWTQGQLLVEARVEGEALDGSHWRRPLNPTWFLRKLLDFNYEVRYFEVDRGFSPVGDDDPLLLRVDAHRV